VQVLDHQHRRQFATDAVQNRREGGKRSPTRDLGVGHHGRRRPIERGEQRAQRSGVGADDGGRPLGADRPEVVGERVTNGLQRQVPAKLVATAAQHDRVAEAA
jgi:hypothetical protein